MYRLLYWKEKRRVRNLQSRVRKLRDRLVQSGRRIDVLRRNLTQARRDVGTLEHGWVVEVCPSCESEIRMVWDPKKQGLHAHCPVCGSRLMLCSECNRACDYDWTLDTCKEM